VYGTISAPGMGMWRSVSVLVIGLPLFARAADANVGSSFAFELKDGFMWVKVSAAKSAEPLNFLVDTGAEVSTLSLQAAKRLNLKGGRQVRVAGVGARSTGYWPQKLRGNVAGVALPTQFLVTDLCALQASCQCPVDGLLGADFFRGRIVQIDFPARQVRLLTTSPGYCENSVPIRFRRSIMQVPLAVNGKEPQWVRLDTGCASALEWVSADTAKGAKVSRLSIGLTGVRIPTVRNRVQLGATSFDRVETGVHEVPLFASERGLLGLGLLAQFGKVTIDAQRGRLILSDLR
jgi:hypothetical protein